MTTAEVTERLRAVGVDVTIGGKCPGGANGAYYVSVEGEPDLVLKWHEHPDAFDANVASFDRIERLRISGVPLVPARRRPVLFDGGVAFLQRKVEGAWRDDVDDDCVSALLAVNDRQAKIGDGAGAWRTTFERTLQEGGATYCRHKVIADYSPMTRRMVALARSIGSAVPDLPTEDIVHFDFHHRNVLRSGSRITAIVDWEDARSGDRWFDVVTLYFGLSIAQCTEEVQEQLYDVLVSDADRGALAVYGAHMALRLLDWAITFESGDVIDRVLRRSEDFLTRLGAL